MAENELQKLIKGIFSRIKEKYGYTDEQALIYLQGLQDCAEENQQSLEKRDKMLRDTVEELCEAKRLLKLAVENMNDGGCTRSCSTCKYGRNGCKYTEGYEWIHTDEALKLLGEEGESDG